MKIPVSYSIKSLFQRKVSTLVTVASFALVVLVLLALLAMVQGVNATLISAGADNRLFVLNRNATTENQSRIDTGDVSTIGLYPELKLNADGRPVTSAEMVKTSYVETLSGERIQVNFRGVDLEKARSVHYHMTLVAGRFFDASAYNEVILGETIFEGMGAHIGDVFTANRQIWRVVGVFRDNGSPFESEVWTSTGNMASAFDLYEFSSVWMVINSPRAMPALVEKLNSDPKLFVYAISEKQYFAQGTTAAQGFKALTWFIAFILSIGATFSAMNTMYASLADRTGEIGALRAIGFPASAVRWATLLETLIMAVLGWLLATIFVYVLQGTTFRTPLTGLGYVSFKLTITPFLIITGFLFSLAMGLIGGWIPARHATRMPIIEALNS
ncbi:ABC transporter permease [Fodinibius sediminis]|uniref:Putative ABC transport system permease protein n=1 Tax=Fodinibius sediminis TaxID=1214077 RepID=A0A521BPU0_9BACT|nr:FtsX-like permease family protein [Fodinibius sediminis]SMO49143.1 putative ABC transport system permease protein [Fodinibius sediminis]